MSKADFAKAIEKAQEVVEANYVMSPPVRVEEIVKNYGLSIIEADFANFSEDVAGFIDPNKKTIYVNKDDTETRKAFTIAHELGHYLLHQAKLKDDDTYKILYRKPLGEINKDPVEQEANCFAANLLVPKELLDKFKNENINTIAKIFGVSVDVIGFRMKREYGGI